MERLRRRILGLKAFAFSWEQGKDMTLKQAVEYAWADI